jgi:hypothetical protein
VEINWQITTDDKACVKAIIEKQQNTELVRDRHARNLAETKPHVTKERLWEVMVCMRLTTLASSGPKSKLATFQSLSPFPLTYDKMCEKQKQSCEDFILRTLRTHEVGTHRIKISQDLANVFNLLENHEGQRALDQCNRLVRLEQREIEAAVANYINDTFKGFGPKQSRNVLQTLGLTRYEIPIDSRVTNWLNDKLKFPFKLTSKALSDRDCYRLVLDAVCKLCSECETYPYPIKPDYNSSGDAQHDFDTKVAQYVTKELNNIDGFTLLDDANRYKIVMPNGWAERAKQPMKVKAASTVN